MKKNFLLLLMAFLSLSAFAETDISTDPKVSMSTGNVTYGGGVAPAIQVLYDGYKLTVGLGNDYTWDEKYYTTEACTAQAVDDTETPYTIGTLPAGTYYVQVQGVGVYTGKRVASFEVKKREVTVALTGGGLEKVFGAADPAIEAGDIAWPTTPAEYAAAGFVGDDTEAVFDLTSLSYTHEGVNASTTPYPVTVTGAVADNYTLKITGGITINAKTIAAGMITPVTLSAKYKGAPFTEFAVNIKDGSTPLVPGTDFVLGVYSDAAMTTPATPQNVGSYYLGISSKANANYSVTTEPTAVGTFTIEKAGLTVRALNQTLVYNGTQTLPDATTVDVAYQLIGVQGSDVFTAPTLTVGNGSVGANNAGAHPIVPSYTPENPNYDFNYVEGTLNITKRGLTIKANDAKKVYKKAESTVTKMDGSAKDAIGYAGVTFTPTQAYEGEGFTMLAADVTLMRNTYATTNATTKKNGTLRVTRSAAGTDENKGDYTGALTVTYNEAGTVWNNYDVTVQPGDFHITGGKLYITALKQSKNYGEADPSWTAVEEKAGNQNANYRVDGISAPDVVTGVTLTCTHEEAVGTYTINIAATGVPAGYEEIVFVPATFQIKQRPIAIVANVQTLKIGDTPSNLDQNAYEITSTAANEGLIAGDKASDVFSLTTANPLTAAGSFAGAITKVDGAKAANYNITFTAGKLIVIDPASTIALNRPAKAAYTADPTLDNAASVIATAAGQTYSAVEAAAANSMLDGAMSYGAIKTPAVLYTEAEANIHNATLDDAIAAGTELDATQAAAVNAELGTTYNVGDEITGSDANAYNATLPLAVSEGDEKEPAVLYTNEEVDAYNAALDGAIAEGDPKQKTVTFGDFTMIAEKWYPIVLPFATSVREVSNNFGYAIVNMLKADNTDNTKIAFKLHMGDIPANTPFVVKVYENINMNEVSFVNKTIVNSAAPETTDASGVKFIGSYSAKTDGFKANEAFFSVSADKNDYYWGSATNTTYMAPLAAYFQIPEGSPARTIEFQDADGTVTAIEAVAADFNGKNAEGWYTIGGVKLQAAPTQKGVYIKDGKKFVIK